jgi:cytochrome c biogenesis protein CcmG, thiol:disulfide interchange protein DsbE
VLDGSGSFALEDVRGRPVLLNFWASWCAPCVEEAPVLRRAHDLYGDEVSFVGVDVKDAQTDARAFARRHGLDYTHVRDTGAIYADYGLTGQPESFLIDSDGVVVEHVTGPFADAQDLFSRLDVLVARDG